MKINKNIINLAILLVISSGPASAASFCNCPWSGSNSTGASSSNAPAPMRIGASEELAAPAQMEIGASSNAQSGVPAQQVMPIVNPLRPEGSGEEGATHIHRALIRLILKDISANELVDSVKSWDRSKAETVKAFLNKADLPHVIGRIPFRLVANADGTFGVESALIDLSTLQSQDDGEAQDSVTEISRKRPWQVCELRDGRWVLKGFCWSRKLGNWEPEETAYSLQMPMSNLKFLK